MSLPHKESKYCGTEVQSLVRVLLDNTYLLTVSEDEVFAKMAESLNGKRTKQQVRLWWENLKRIFHEEKRFTAVVENYVPEEHKSKLKELITGVKTGLPVIQRPASPVEGLHSEEENVRRIILDDSVNGNDSKEKAIQEAILTLFAALSLEGKQAIREAIAQL